MRLGQLTTHLGRAMGAVLLLGIATAVIQARLPSEMVIHYQQMLGAKFSHLAPR